MKPGRPQANLRLETKTVEELVGLVARGEVRVPSPLRGLRWTAEDVVALFDSIYRGYPIGSFLLREGPAEAARIQVGPLSIDAPESGATLWIVDGQQRLTALTAGLLRPAPVPATPDDPWVVYFDASSQKFFSPPREGRISSTWVPVAHWLAPSVFHKWLAQWPHAGDPDLRSAVFEAGSLIRRYQIPLSVVQTEDEGELQEIFHRINNSRKGLRWEDVRDGLIAPPVRSPSTLQEMAEDLRKVGMGAPTRNQMLSCLAAFRGLGSAPEELLSREAPGLLSAVRRALSFLKLHAEIPHLRLLPRSIPLPVLTRFFAVYPEPKERSLTLLTRWTWRLLWSTGPDDLRTLLRHGVTAIQEGDEEKCIQLLISLVPKERRQYVLPLRFEARAVDSRIALLGMASLRPRDLGNGAPIDVSALIEQHGVDAFRRIVPEGGPIGSGLANRLLSAGPDAARNELVELARLRGRESDILLSHAISNRAADALLQGDVEAFLQERAVCLEEAVRLLGARLAEWSRNDRPSISYLLAEAEIEA